MDYQVTGNEYVSLPTIREKDGSIESISCLYMGVKGMLELKGKDYFIQPYVSCDDRLLSLRPEWKREHFWIPSFISSCDEIAFRCTYLSPIGERGFAVRLEAQNQSDARHQITIGVQGDCSELLHTVNESISLTQGKSMIPSNWNNMFVFQCVPGAPLIAFAPVISDHSPFSEVDQGAEWEQNGFFYAIHKTTVLQPGESFGFNLFFGVGYEEVAATTSAKEMLRQGFDTLHQRMSNWLSSREKHISNPMLNTILNTNLFFSFFFASGRTIDTEELCMMTSRSPRYYVSAAYWDRDSLLWAFPAILEADPSYARELLLAVFRRQSRNFGVHSRYIDGTVLEPGFELDELCAPVIALERYISATEETEITKNIEISEALRSIARKLEERKHPNIDLYSTFLQPTDDKHNYQFLTYDNMLVWKTLSILGKRTGRLSLKQQAEHVRAAIEKYCVFEHEGKQIYAWSVDLKGNWDIYDEPPGSLQVFPFYGYCDMNNQTWTNTVHLIRDKEYSLSFAGHAIAEIGCKHAPHPWILSICNSLLAGYTEEAFQHLLATKMDNGIACESVDEDTGKCTTGAAFATCAGFLAYSISKTLKC